MRTMTVVAVIHGIAVVEHEVVSTSIVGIEFFVSVVHAGIQNCDLDTCAQVPAAMRLVGLNARYLPRIGAFDVVSRRRIEGRFLDIGNIAVLSQVRDFRFGETGYDGRNELEAMLDSASDPVDRSTLREARPLFVTDNDRLFRGLRSDRNDHPHGQQKKTPHRYHARSGFAHRYLVCLRSDHGGITAIAPTS